MTFHAPCVLRKAGGRHAIVIKKGRTLYEVVEMSKNSLIVKKVAEKQLLADGYAEVTGVSPAKTAESFLQHQAGVSKNAMLALNEVITLRFLE